MAVEPKWITLTKDGSSSRKIAVEVTDVRTVEEQSSKTRITFKSGGRSVDVSEDVEAVVTALREA